MSPASSPIDHRLLVGVALLVMTAAACASETEELAARLPRCGRVCAGNIALDTALEIDADSIRLWKSGSATAIQNDDAIGALARSDPTSRILPILCPRDVLGSRVAEVANHDELNNRPAILLAGFDGSRIGFASFRLFDAPERDKAASNVPIEHMDKARVDAVLDGTDKALHQCPPMAEAPCPIVVVNPSEYTCAEILGTADQLSVMNRLLGLGRHGGRQ